MKKYFLTMATVALFAVGFAASDEEESSSNESPATQTELKQETEAERQAREAKEEQERAEKEREKLAKEGYDEGYKRGFGATDFTYLQRERLAFENWKIRHKAPSNPQEKELFNLFKDNYVKGFEEAYNGN